MGLIYLAKNKENGHMYIGKTNGSLEVRKQGHLYDATKRHRNTAFCNAIRKYGLEGFDWSILEDDILDEELNDKEKYYIAKYNTFLNKQHYNMTEGGDGFSPSEEIRRKISEAKTGKKLTEEHKRRIGESGKGRKNSQETKKKMSFSAKESWTEERRNLMSETMKNKHKSEEHRKHLSEAKIKKETLVAKNEVETLIFSDRKEAYDYLVDKGLVKGAYKTFTVSIRNSIKSKQNRYGFKWRIEKSNVETKESSEE